MGYIFISNINPLDFVDTARSLPPEYNFKHFDEYKWNERILPWQQARCYRQKWQNNDFINLQVEADHDPINVKIIDSEGSVHDSFLMAVIASIGSRIFLECHIDLSTLPEGVYKVTLDDGVIFLESNEIEIAARWPNTLLFKVSNNTNKELLWQTGIQILFRIEGTISLYTPTGSRTVYVDTPFNSRTVKGYSARDFTLFIGDGDGVPDNLVDKIQDYFDCNNLTLDGKGFSAKEDSKLAPKREDDVTWAGWSMIVTESVNRRGKRFETTGLVEFKVAIDYIVEGKLFGPTYGSANNNTYTINKVE